MLKRVVRCFVDARGNRGADDGRVGHVLGKKSTMCVQRLSVGKSEFVEFAVSEEHDDQFDEGFAGANRSSDGGVIKQCCVGEV